MGQRFVNIFCCIFLLLVFISQAQDEGVKSPKYKDYKSDTTYNNFSTLRFKVARAQIAALKNGGALLVRLKTNERTIKNLKASGNMDLAAQVERETLLKNQVIMAAYLLEFKFCPVYFFYSTESDSVKHQKLNGILLDTTLTVNSSIVCSAPFYLIAESDQIYNSSLGIVKESLAASSVERGNPVRSVRIVIKNRYFIQLHKPFPYFQIKGNASSTVSTAQLAAKGLVNIYSSISKDKDVLRELKNFRGCVKSFNDDLESFYKKNPSTEITADIKEFVY